MAWCPSGQKDGFKTVVFSRCLGPVWGPSCGCEWCGFEAWKPASRVVGIHWGLREAQVWTDTKMGFQRVSTSFQRRVKSP